MNVINVNTASKKELEEAIEKQYLLNFKGINRDFQSKKLLIHGQEVLIEANSFSLVKKVAIRICNDKWIFIELYHGFGRLLVCPPTEQKGISKKLKKRFMREIEHEGDKIWVLDSAIILEVMVDCLDKRRKAELKRKTAESTNLIKALNISTKTKKDCFSTTGEGLSYHHGNSQTDGESFNFVAKVSKKYDGKYKINSNIYFKKKNVFYLNVDNAEENMAIDLANAFTDMVEILVGEIPSELKSGT